MQKDSVTQPVQQDRDKQEHTSSCMPSVTQVGLLSQLPYRYILWLFTTTRVLLILVTYIGVVLLTVPKYSSTPTYFYTLLSAWNHWDASNYVRIAQYGYQTVPDLAFFPLYPACIWLISHVVGNYIFVGIMLSNLAVLGVLVVIYQLALDIAGEQVARRTLLYLCIFPTAFFFFAAYNESVFILFAAGAFLACVVNVGSLQVYLVRWQRSHALQVFSSCYLISANGGSRGKRTRQHVLGYRF